jgi:uncharacterized protein YndB with AHSA1/START domain
MATRVATARTEIEASPQEVWKALTDPALIGEYMFGTTVETDWKPGSPIVWKGEYEGKRYEDKGEILDFDPAHRLSMSHFSALSGLDDRPENYHTVVYELEQQGDATVVSLSQDGNDSEEAAERSQSTWETVLAGLKETVERR